MPKQPRMGNMQQMLEQVQRMQREMVAAQEQLKNEIVEASVGAGWSRRGSPETCTWSR